jgi:hypothetical protein
LVSIGISEKVVIWEVGQEGVDIGQARGIKIRDDEVWRMYEDERLRTRRFRRGRDESGRGVEESGRESRKVWKGLKGLLRRYGDLSNVQLDGGTA